ncbi:hypothetical protein TIFTF001_024840 [Ficus carica]|uniref:Pentatricopeptide repeat-containing protein n=1 Tax=Ficus carica TaxID=3494 RepID=A0AA88AN33_FICCA|nr:hypothetical protein TIFTF001_024840 [Ficus carica]
MSRPDRLTDGPTMEITTMAEALQLNGQILKSGNTHDLSKLFTFSALSPSGDLAYARLLLRSLPSPTSFHYNSILRAYSQSPDPVKALHLFLSMVRDSTRFSFRPDKFTYPFLLKSCARLRLTHEGKQLHGLVVKSGLCSDRYVRHSLIHMYGKCGEPPLARKMFDEMSERDAVSWTSIIDGLVDNDMPLEALRLFEEMVEDGVEVNEATVVSVLRACADAGALGVGRRVHELVEERRVGLKGNVRTALIDMYTKCGCIESARRVFDEGDVGEDVFAWTAMIAGLASNGKCREAIELFDHVREY